MAVLFKIKINQDHAFTCYDSVIFIKIQVQVSILLLLLLFGKV